MPNTGNLSTSDELIDPKLLRILGCPLEDSRPPFRVEGTFLICSSCGSGFPIRDGIPDLLPESAIPPDELARKLKENK